MTAFQSVRHSTAPPQLESVTQPRLSVRAAIMCILTLSVLGWTAVLLPLWAIAQ